MDSTIIEAPSSAKNKKKERDPDAHQVKKGNTWHFGYKAHIGVDQDSGLVHSIEVTDVNTHYGDGRYLSAEKWDDTITRNTNLKRRLSVVSTKSRLSKQRWSIYSES